MATFNNCTFVGRLGRDPEVRYFEGGTALATFSIPVDSPKTKDGESKTWWLTVKVWGKQATVIADYARKGSELAVTGEFEMESWTKDGQERTRPCLNCRKFTFVGRRSDSGESSSSAGFGGETSTTKKPLQKQQSRPEPEEDEVPF